MDGLITIVCYRNGEIMNGPNGVCYNCPPEKGLLVSNLIKYAELEDKICHVMSIDRNYTKIFMIFRYPILMAIGNGNITYIQLPIKDDDDVRLMFHVVAQIPPSNTVEIYLQTCPRDHSPETIEPSPPIMNEMRGHCEEVAVEGNLAMHNDEVRGNLVVDTDGMGGNLAVVTQSVMMAKNNYVDIPLRNDDDGVEFDDEDEIDENIYDDEALTNKTHNYHGEHVMPSPMFKQLNWDAISGMTAEPLTSRTGLWNESNELFKGLRFESKEDLQYAVKRYSVCRNQHLVVCESEPHLWAVRCKKWQEGCNWRLRACRRKTHGMFEITKYTGSHTCVYPKLSQDHSQLDSTLIAREIQNVVQRDHTTSIATLHQIVKDKFGYDVHYRRIWEAKRKAMLRVFGDWDESYQALPKWMNILKLTNPGTKIVWKTIPLAGTPGNMRFMCVFWTFGPCVEGFNHCRPIIQIDGTFLYEKYKGKLLIATSIDANGHIFPLAFAIVEEESQDSWSWFLIALRRHVTQREGICLISDRHAGINAAIRNPSVGWSPPHAHHRYCLRHVVSNFNDKFKSKVLKDLAYRAGSQHQPRKYERCMDELKRLDEKSVGWFSKLETHKWTQAYDLGFRYGWMTTNIAECINGVLKGARMLPITALVQLTFYRCVSYFETRRAEISARIASGDVYTSYAINKFRRAEVKASGHTVTIFHRINQTFEVITALHGFI